MKKKVGLETVVKEIPETVKRSSDYSYLEPFIPKDIQGKFRFPDEIRRFRHDDAERFWQKGWPRRLWTMPD